MNLDGGGSATMVVGGRIVNTPSDGFERMVASALVVLRRPVESDRVVKIPSWAAP
jgi:exopolysaccharide biosynthesis protein